MNRLLFHTLWGWQDSLEAASRYAKEAGFDGLEANLEHACLSGWRADEVQTLLNQQNQPLIIEITTGGGYTPKLELTPEQHLAELETKLEQASKLTPLRITLITGSDSWPMVQQHNFLERCLQLTSQTPIPVSLETHRSRSLFNPWAIEDILKAHPTLRLTADVSHWCVVAERLMRPELAAIQAMASHVDHIHARVGHEQGAGVPHPFTARWQEALDAHAECWSLFAAHRSRSGQPLTLTPEFGPDGYMPVHPDSGEPLADVAKINQWMVDWLRTGAWLRSASANNR